MNILILLITLSTVFGQLQVFRKTEHRGIKPNSEGKFTMDNEKDFQYFAWIGIGTPAQNCSIIFNTGSDEFWVSTIWGDYQSGSSQTFNETSESSNITYGSKFVSGYIGTEMVSIPQISITNVKQQMLFVNYAQEIGKETDGLLGLINDPDSLNWLDLAYNAGQLPDAIFAFDLRNQDVSTYFYASSQSFPQETLTWVDVDQSYYWAIKIGYTTIDGLTEPQNFRAQTAVIDTGSSLLIMGATGYDMLKSNQQILQCQFNEQSEIYICPCSANYPTITFSYTEYNYLAVPSDYMIKLQAGYCALGVKSNSDLGTYLMTFGDSLMRNYFVAYDKANSKIGFSAPESQQIKKFKKFLN